MPCDIYLCTRPALYKTWRADKIAPKHFCARHLADKVAKYELRAEHIPTMARLKCATPIRSVP